MTASRLTFRKAAGGVCWQRQLRDRYNVQGAPNVDLALKRAQVRPVTRALAEQIILKYEWLGTLPAGCTHYYGIFFGLYCAGVECICVGGGGANVYAYKEFGLAHQTELAYLARGANVHWSPPGANSKLVSWTCKLLARDTSAKLAIAYADSDAGEIGTIYQACNWVYIGQGSFTLQWIAPNGRIYDQKHASNIAKKLGVARHEVSARMYDLGWREQRSNPKHRYVYVLQRSDSELVDLIERKRQPYPKRAGVVQPVEQPGPLADGGSKPTHPLEQKHACEPV